MSQAVSSSIGIRYGLARVCNVWRFARSTFYDQRRRMRHGPTCRRRPGPMGPCCDADLVDRIRGVLQASPFHGEGYRKVWARLRYQGIRTSRARILRLMRQHGLQAPHRVGRCRGPRNHDGTIIPDAVDVMWGTDMTATLTLEEGPACVFVAIDHFSGAIVGIHASKDGTRFEALEPIRQGVRERFGAFGAQAAQGLQVRHDHGSQYMSRDFQDELKFLGIESSPAFVRAPEGNGCAERVIRTLKENLLWLRTFRNIEGLRRALLTFKALYNREWILERHGYRTPDQVRGLVETCLAAAA